MSDRLEELYPKIYDLVGYAVRKGWVGRRRLQQEWGLTRAEAEEVLDRVRNPAVDKDTLVLLDELNDHEYDEDRDRYRFEGVDQFDEDVSFELEGEKVRRMKKDYTIRGYKIKETAIKHGLPQFVFDQIRRHMEWTHDSVPATEEEIRREETEEIAERMAMEVRKEEVRSQIDKKKRRQLRKDAKKYRHLEETILEEFYDILSDKQIPEPPTVTLPKGSKVGEPHCLVLPMFDLHYGKQGIIRPDGTSYNRGEAERHLIDKTQELIDDVQHRNVEEVLLVVGSDHFHVDGHHGATTGGRNNDGTFQDLDGLPVQILDEGCDLTLQQINMLRQLDTVKRIRIVMVPGNHDRILSFALIKFLEAALTGEKGIEVIKNYNSRWYGTYGNTLMGFDHGDGIRKKEVSNIVMSEARHLMSATRETVFFGGHLHHEVKLDMGGLTYYQIASLSDSDRWHEKKGYTGSRRQMTAFLMGRTRGMHLHINLPVFV